MPMLTGGGDVGALVSAQDGMRLFLQLKALGSVNVEDLLRALLAKLPLPPANGSSLAVRFMESEAIRCHL